MCIFERFHCFNYEDDYCCPNYSRIAFRAPCKLNPDADLAKALECSNSNLKTPRQTEVSDEWMWMCRDCRVGEHKVQWLAENASDIGKNTHQWHNAQQMAEQHAQMKALDDDVRYMDSDVDDGTPYKDLVEKAEWPLYRGY